MKNDLNLYVPQYYPSELVFGVSKLKSDMNIIYSNCILTLNIENQIIETGKFDTVLYNEENSVLILLMKNGYITKNDLKKYLELNKSEYSEIIFNQITNEYEETDSIFDISLVNKKYILEGELKEALSRGKKSCEFYPNVVGTSELGYFTTSNEKIKLFDISILSLIKLDDQIILIMDQNKYEKNDVIDENIVFNVIKKCGFNCEIILNRKPNLSSEKFIKVLKK